MYVLLIVVYPFVLFSFGCCLFFFDIRILIAPLVSSNSSQVLYCDPLLDSDCPFGIFKLFLHAPLISYRQKIHGSICLVDFGNIHTFCDIIALHMYGINRVEMYRINRVEGMQKIQKQNNNNINKQRKKDQDSEKRSTVGNNLQKTVALTNLLIKLLM